MKRSIILLLFLVFLHAYSQEWDFTGGSCGWHGTANLIQQETPDGLELTFNGNYPNFYIDKLDLTNKGYEVLALTYIAEGEIEGNGGIMFFGTKANPKLNEDAKFYMPAIVADGKEHTSYTSLISGRGKAAWQNADTIISLRLDLVSRFKGKMLLKSIRLLSDADIRAAKKWPPVDSKEWLFNDTNAGWNSSRKLTSTLTPEGMVLELHEPYSNIAIKNIRVDPAGTDFMQIDYIATGIPASTSGQLFFGTNSAPEFNEKAKFAVGSLIGDGKPHSRFVNLHIGESGKNWEDAKAITSMRLDLVNQFPGRITISAIRLVNGDAYWAEQDKKYAKWGIPARVKPEIPLPSEDKALTLLDPNAPSFSSPMVAPQNGFYFVGTNYLRTEFTLDKLPSKNLLQSMCDDQIVGLYLNETKIERKWSDFWRTEDCVELPQQLFRVGKNVLCIAYENGSSIGGLMMDLQLVYPNGDYQVITPSQGIGTTKKPNENWTKLDFECDWSKVATRPGPPSAPWTRVIPRYTSIKATEGTVEVSPKLIRDCEVEVTFRGNPPLSENDKFFGKYTTQGGTLITSVSGSFKELEGKANPDGSVTISFNAFKIPVYGVAQQGCWIFGAYGRSASGTTSMEVSKPERILVGQPAVLKLMQTKTGPVPMLNGKPFYFNILTSHQYRQQFKVYSGMEGANSPFNVVVIRAGGAMETDWWKGPDTYDFSALDRSLSQLMYHYPDSMLGLYLWCHPGKWYEKAYPERISEANDGTQFGYYMATVSFSDPEVRADAQRAVEALVTHCEKYFGPKMVLYNLMGGISCEWQGWQSHTPKFADFGEHATRDFVKYASEHGFKDAVVPDANARTASDGGIFRNPKRDALAMLYDQFYSESIAECIRGIAEVTKKASKGNKLVGCYYGYLLEYGNLGHCVNGGGHNDVARLLASPHMDFFLSPQSYGIRALGMPNAEMKPFAAIREAGKLSILEDDTRTHLIQPTGFDQTVTMEQTLNVLKRNVGMYLAHKMPLNQLPLVGGNELDAPEIREMFAKSVQAGQYLMEKGLDPTTEIAAVVDETALKYLAATRYKHAMNSDGSFIYSSKGEISEKSRSVQALTGELLYYQREKLGQIGAPVDIILLPDVKRMASKYKIIIFLNAFADSKELEQAFASIKKNNTTAVIVYGAGFIDDNGFNTKAMSRLAGMEIGNASPGHLMLDWGNARTFGSEYEVNPRFAVLDSKATALAKYAESEAVSVAEKGNCLFYGAATLDADFMREYARRKGVHIYCDSQDNLCAGGSIVTINARSAGRKILRLPRRFRVEDIYSGEIMATDADVFEFDMKAFETRVFICK